MFWYRRLQVVAIALVLVSCASSKVLWTSGRPDPVHKTEATRQVSSVTLTDLSPKPGVSLSIAFKDSTLVPKASEVLLKNLPVYAPESKTIRTRIVLYVKDYDFAFRVPEQPISVKHRFVDSLHFDSVQTDTPGMLVVNLKQDADVRLEVDGSNLIITVLDCGRTDCPPEYKRLGK